MIAVVFEPRFGSSKVMQTLADSGYPVAGDKFPEWVTEDQKQWNPMGFYEHANPRKVIAEGFRGAIKLRTHEAMSFPLPGDTRFILCLRDPKAATDSQIRSGLVQWSDPVEGEAVNRAKYVAVSAWLEEKHVLPVSHEAWIEDPDGEKQRLLEWINGV